MISAGGCRWRASRPVRTGGTGPSRRRVPRRAGEPYAPSVRAHSETVLRGFLRLPPGGGHRADRQPVPAGPVPAGRAGARPPQSDGAVPQRARRALPAEGAAAGSRAASRTRSSTRSSPGCPRTGTGRWSPSTSRPGRGPRSCCRPRSGGVDPGRQVITVVRKGTRELQELPASTDAFVWLRLYQVEMEGLIPRGVGSRCGGRCAGRSGR